MPFLNAKNLALYIIHVYRKLRKRCYILQLLFTNCMYSQLSSFHTCFPFTSFMFHNSFFFLFKYMHTLKCPHYSIKSFTWATYKNIYTQFFFIVKMPFFLWHINSIKSSDSIKMGLGVNMLFCVLIKRFCIWMISHLKLRR